MNREMDGQTDTLAPLAIRRCNIVSCTKNSEFCVHIPDNMVRSTDDNIMF